MPPSVSTLAPRRGRPRKFLSPTRAVTLTLPEQVLETLASIDPDISRAVVRLTQTSQTPRPSAGAELTSFGRRAVIVVGRSRTLEARTGVFQVPLSDGRALIAFDESLTPAGVELAINDALNEPLPQDDAQIFEGIRDVLREVRRSGRARIQQRSIIVIEFPRRHTSPSDAREKRVRTNTHAEA